MDESNVSTVNAEPEVNVEPQATEQTTEVNGEGSEVATEQPTERPVQSAEDNAKFASMRREYEARIATESQKAIDAEYDRMFGAEYGIHSKAEYDERIAQQQAEEQRQQYQEQYGIDPNAVQPLIDKALENHPAVIQARKQANALQLDNAAMELSKVAKSLGINEEIKSWADVEKLPKYEAIKEQIMKGNDIVNSAKLAYFDDMVQARQQETIARIAANGAGSPGSLAGQGEPTTNDYANMSSSDFKAIQERALRGELRKS